MLRLVRIATLLLQVVAKLPWGHNIRFLEAVRQSREAAIANTTGTIRTSWIMYVLVILSLTYSIVLGGLHYAPLLVAAGSSGAQSKLDWKEYTVASI